MDSFGAVYLHQFHGEIVGRSCVFHWHTGKSVGFVWNIMEVNHRDTMGNSNGLPVVRIPWG